MSPKEAWEALGIDPTDDKRAVKRAYAVKLKSIDPDADPKAFLALRDALQIAQWEAEYGPEEDYDYEDYSEGSVAPNAEDVPELSGAITDDDIDQFQIEPASPQHEFEPQMPSSEWAAQQRIEGLIWQEDRTAAEDAELVTSVRMLLADPRMDQVDFASDTEEWLARTMAYAIPQSDPIITIVSKHFGWDARRMNVRDTFGVTECADRAADLVCLAKLSEPSHQWHDAYQRLKCPGPAKISFVERRRHKTVTLDLLNSLRTHNPDVEQSLDAAHVAAWDAILVKDLNNIANTGTASDWGKWRMGFFILLFLAQFLRLCMPDTASTPENQPHLSITPEQEIILWQVQQAPRVQAWMLANRARVDEIFLAQMRNGGGPPTCAVLDAAANLTKAEYDQCYSQQVVRDTLRPKLPPLWPSPAPLMTSPTPQGSYFHSPLWQSEQAPRVRKWMEQNRAAVDRLLQPHVKGGGLPDCRKLAAVASLTPGELDQCRAGQRRRQVQYQPPLPSPPPMPQPSPFPMETKAADPQDVCTLPAMAGSALCLPPAPPTPAPPAP